MLFIIFFCFIILFLIVSDTRVKFWLLNEYVRMYHILLLSMQKQYGDFSLPT